MIRRDEARLLALLFCVYSSIAVLLMAALVPPLENPDEINHVHRAEQVASGQWLARRYAGPQTSGGMVDLGVNRTDGPIGAIRFHADRKVTRAMLDQAGAIGWGPPTGITFANTSIYPPFFYLPAALGIRIGQMLHRSIARTLVLARILNGLCCIALATLAIAASGGMAPLLFTLLCLPMSLSLFASVSQDGLMLASAAGAMAAMSRAGCRSRPGPALLLLLCTCLALLAMARPAYLPLLVLPLLLPELPWRARLAGGVGALVAVLVWIGLVARFTLINANGYRAADPHAQLRFLLGHVGRWGTIALGTLHRQGATGYSFFQEFVGVLGWSDVALPGGYYVAAVPVLATALLLSSTAPRPVLTPVGRAIMSGAALIAILLIFLFESLSWTAVGAGFVDGVQGRYFLPVAMVLPCLLPAQPASASRALLVLVMGFPVLSIAIAVHSLVLRYYL